MGALLSVLVAILGTINTAYVKKGASEFSLLVVVWFWQTFSLLVFLPFLFFFGIPDLNLTFFVAASIKVAIYLLTLFLYSAALRLADVSLALPMLAFSPIVTMLTSFFLSNEFPSKAAFLGVFLIILGAYWINTSKENTNLFAPIRALVKNQGVMYMFFVAILWGITSSLDKVAVVNSSPVFYSTFVAALIASLLTFICFAQMKVRFLKLLTPANLKRLVPIGVLDGMITLLQMTAVGLTLAAYVSAIKRSSIIFSTVLSHFVFKEAIKDRIRPIILMFLGILLILLTGK